MTDAKSPTLAAAESGASSLEPARQTIAGRYEVLGMLGVGGMGAVYRVLDKELDEVIALKMLRRELADSPGIVERFRREVKLARKVTHVNVARTYDLGEHEGERFLTMELVEGESLSTLLARERRFSLSRMVDLALPICAGLAAAHAMGIVHRDLKPDNVLIAKDGRVVLTDFGIARATGSAGSQRTALPIGTPAYMAPEQVEASPNVDERADIYALGAMFFELLTGQLPWQGDSVYAVAALRLVQPPPDPRTHRPDLPDAVARLVMACMARKPEDRPATVVEVASRLTNITLPASPDSIAPPRRSVPGQVRTEPGQKTVAVLPFRNAGPAEDEYLSDGLTDDLIDALSMTPGLRVRPRGVVMRYKGMSTDPRELGRELDVQVVVEGTVRTAGDSLRVNARVLSVADGFQLWAKRFDGTRSEVLRMGDDASRAIAEALTVEAPVRAPLTDPEAVDLYLRGRHEFFKFWTDATDRAIDLLRQAHERAPDDPLIMSGYALALARRVSVVRDDGDRHELARKTVARALALAPQMGEPYAALAAIQTHDGDTLGAARSVRKALQLSPQLADAHDQCARMLSETNATVEALLSAQHAIQLEPRLVHLRYVMARVSGLLGDWEEVDRIFRVPPADTDDANLYWMIRTRLVSWTRNKDKAAELLVELDAAPTFTFQMMVRGMCGVMLKGDMPLPARAFLEDRTHDETATKRTRAFFCQLMAELLGAVHDGEGALAAVEEACACGLYDLLWLDRCPLLDEIRDTERFQTARKDVEARSTAVVAILTGANSPTSATPSGRA